VYQWLAGGFFLVHHVDVMIGQRQVRALELIGEYDPATDSFTARAYDNLGDVTTMQARVDEQGVWRFTGGGDVASVPGPPLPTPAPGRGQAAIGGCAVTVDLVAQAQAGDRDAFARLVEPYRRELLPGRAAIGSSAPADQRATGSAGPARETISAASHGPRHRLPCSYHTARSVLPAWWDAFRTTVSASSKSPRAAASAKRRAWRRSCHRPSPVVVTKTIAPTKPTRMRSMPRISSTPSDISAIALTCHRPRRARTTKRIPQRGSQ
jgi:hypothetical protein